MAVPYLVPIDLTLNELQNFKVQMLASDPSILEAQLWYLTGTHKLRYYDGTAKRNIATEDYVDSVAQGLSGKGSCKLATTAALATNTYANGSSGVGATLTATANAALTIDSVATTVGDRVLIKDEATVSKNGIYTVTATGSGAAPYVLTRSTDMDIAAEVPGAYTYVEAGTVNGSNGWLCTTTGSITMGSTSITWTQFSGAGQINTRNGLSKTGNTIDVNVDSTTTYIDGSNNVAVKSSGSNADILKSAGSGSAVWQKWKAEGDLGNGAATSFAITHGILPATKAIQVTVYDNTTPFSEVKCDVQHTSTTVITLLFSVAPTTNQYHYVMEG